MAKIINLLGDVTTKQKILSDFLDNFSENLMWYYLTKNLAINLLNQEINKEIKLIYTNIKGFKK